MKKGRPYKKAEDSVEVSLAELRFLMACRKALEKVREHPEEAQRIAKAVLKEGKNVCD